MTKTEWWRGLDPEQKEQLAKELNTTASSLGQMFNGYRNSSPSRSRKLVKAAGQLAVGNPLTLAMLRPDLWASDQAA